MPLTLLEGEGRLGGMYNNIFFCQEKHSSDIPKPTGQI